MSIHFPYVPATYRNIPKTGTTSFKWWSRDNIKNCEILEDPSRIYNMQHLSLEEIQQKWPNYGTTFTFVRNPFDRMVSIFHHVLKFYKFIGRDLITGYIQTLYQITMIL